MLAPKRGKYRKIQKGRMRGKSQIGNTVVFGSFGLQSLSRGWMTNHQIEATRIAITRYIKRGGEVFIRVFPDKPFTKKPAETRMGKGKGAPEGWIAVVRPGRMLYEIGGEISRDVAQKAFRLATYKLPFATRFVDRSDYI